MRLFIFDVGGVMVDGFDVAPAIATQLGLELGALRSALDESGADDLHAGLISPAAFWRRFEARTGLHPEGEPWRDHFAPTRRPAMYALVESLKAGGARVVAGTNTIDPHYAVHVANGDYAAFDHVYASHLMGLSKPDPAFWRHILAAEGASADEAVFVDDLAVNVAGAASLGITAVQYLNESQAIAALEAARAA